MPARNPTFKACLPASRKPLDRSRSVSSTPDRMSPTPCLKPPKSSSSSLRNCRPIQAFCSLTYRQRMAGPTNWICVPPWRSGDMGEAPDLTLWGVGTSRTIRPHWAMHELGLSYRTKAIGPRTGETKTAEYTRLNPRQKVPLLQDGDFCIGESAAIVAYLSRMYSTPESSLIPETPREYAAWLEWCFFIVAELDSTSLYGLRRHRADALGPIYGVAPEVVAKAGEYFREQLRHVEVALADGRQFLMGDRFTSADILLTTCLDWAIAYGVGICDNAHPYLERIQAREAYQLATGANVPLAPIVPVQQKA